MSAVDDKNPGWEYVFGAVIGQRRPVRRPIPSLPKSVIGNGSYTARNQQSKAMTKFPVEGALVIKPTRLARLGPVVRLGAQAIDVPRSFAPVVWPFGRAAESAVVTFPSHSGPAAAKAIKTPWSATLSQRMLGVSHKPGEINSHEDEV